MIKTLAEIPLSSEVAGTGKVRHHCDGVFVSPEVTALRVIQFEGDSGFYILYLNSDGFELNDLYFDSLAEMKRHIGWEFDGKVDLERLLQNADYG